MTFLVAEKCTVCGSDKLTEPHNMQVHDKWRERIHDRRSKKQTDDDREACGSPPVDPEGCPR